MNIVKRGALFLLLFQLVPACGQQNAEPRTDPTSGLTGTAGAAPNGGAGSGGVSGGGGGARAVGGAPGSGPGDTANPDAACAQTLVVLGAADTFVVLAGSTVTSTGPTSLTGDLGVSPGTAVTGFPPGVIVGTEHTGDPAAAQGEAD
jgi:hypothetical protein